jgi:hypothetical protein
LSEPTHLSLAQGFSHTGVGRGLQIVDLQPHSSVVSTIISHGRQIATLIAGQSFSTHAFSQGQQHSVPSRRVSVFSTWHLLHSGSGILGQLASFSVQQLHGRHSHSSWHCPFTLLRSRYCPLLHLRGSLGSITRLIPTLHFPYSKMHVNSTHGSTTSNQHSPRARGVFLSS